MTPEPIRRWFFPTPGKLLVVLLAVEGILFLSERWIPKGYAVLIAVAAVGLFFIVMLLWFVLALAFRRCFQFSLRSLLVLTVAVAVPASWLTFEMQKAREQREAVEETTKRGNAVYYAYEFNNVGECFHYIPAGLQVDDFWVFGPKPQSLVSQCLRRIFGDDFFYDAVAVEISHIEEAKDLRNRGISKRLNLVYFKVSMNETMKEEEIEKRIRMYLPRCKIKFTSSWHISS